MLMAFFNYSNKMLTYIHIYFNTTDFVTGAIACFFAAEKKLIE